MRLFLIVNVSIPKLFILIFFFASFSFDCEAQQFEKIPLDEMVKSDKKIQFREILTTSKGDMLITASMNFAEIKGNQLSMNFNTGGLTDSKGNPANVVTGNNIFKDAYELHTGFKGICGTDDDLIYLVSDNNNLGWMDYKIGAGLGMSPFNFPVNQGMDIKKIWLDRDGDLFVVVADTIYLIEKAAKVFKPGSKELSFKSKDDKSGNEIITEGAKKIRKFSLGKNILPGCFAMDPGEGIIYIGTNKGLFEFDKITGSFLKLFGAEEGPIEVTDIHVGGASLYVWFSTMEKGMGAYNILSRSTSYYPYKTQPGVKNSIQRFTVMSDKEFLVAPEDSLPAIFNTETYSYKFIDDTLFSHSRKNIADIKIGAGNMLVLIMNGDLYISKDFLKKRDVKSIAYPVEPYLKEFLVGGKDYREMVNYQLRIDSVRKADLRYYENHIDIMYAARGVSSSDAVAFAWKMDGLWDKWQYVPLSMLEERINMVSFDLKPGHYIFRAKMKVGRGDWLRKEIRVIIIVNSPFWQTWWFWVAIICGISCLVFLIVKLRVKSVRKQERLKAAHERELLKLEAKALRSQMNPHFVFNCLNSIKSLIQDDQKDKSVMYLTTFSKLIRALFNNADKKEITLYDEIETCKLYLQLEAMRFDSRLQYSFSIDDKIDLKSVFIPALVIQPFLENAIWHGIVPQKEGGHVSLIVSRHDNTIAIIIDDDGIGRESSRQNKAETSVIHQSKGINLTQSRLELDNMLRQRQAKLEIVDKKDAEGKAAGTKVVLTLPEF